MLNTTEAREVARNARRRLASHSTRLLAGLGLAASLPEAVGEARKNSRQRDGENDRARNDRGDNGNRSNQDGDVNAEKRDDAEKGENRKNRDDRSGDDEDRNVRQESKRQDASTEASDTDQDGESGGGRRGSDDSAELEQRNNNSGDNLDDTPTPTPTPAPAPPTNPNVAIPDTSGTEPDDVELIVQSNPDVIAQTSASGGFAFAQSGGVTAISGPDGAKIIQTGTETVAPTPAPVPSQPSPDGGDNNTDFTS